MSTGGVDPAEDEFIKTEQEEALLSMYDTIKQYEREAKRLQQEAARRKLEASDAAFKQHEAEQQKQKLAAKRKRRREKKRRKAAAAAQSNENDEEMLSEDDEDLEDDDDDLDSDDDSVSSHQRREDKIEALKQQVEDARQKQQDQTQQEEELRDQHLQTADDILDGSTLRRKKRNFDDYDQEENKPSLIAGITATATPPHDFSKKLGLSAIHGKTLFPDHSAAAAAGGEEAVVASKWTPPEGVFSPNDGAFVTNLDKFDVTQAQAGKGNNTLAIKLMAPADSKRFSINICAPNHDNFDSVLFHFNPRQHERGGQLVINDKQEGVWGQAIAIPLSQVPLLFGAGSAGQHASSTLIIQVHGDGFDIFVENQHCARLEHRQDLANADHLVLQFPSTDDYGSPENWTVYKVWWGNRPIMAKGDVSGIAGVNQFNSLHPRKLFVSSLPKIFTESEVDIRRAELERAFAKYGGDRGVVQVIAPTNSTYAFVEMESERLCDLALQEMSGQYRLNRARRSRHEALQEERAAKEAQKLAGVTGTTTKAKDSDGWN